MYFAESLLAIEFEFGRVKWIACITLQKLKNLIDISLQAEHEILIIVQSQKLKNLIDISLQTDNEIFIYR